VSTPHIPVTPWETHWREAGTATVLLRLTARGATGAWTGKAGEGNWVRQVDLSTVTYRAYDETNDNAEVTAGAQTVTIASAVLDTPVTTTVLWTRDSIGYNFLHDLPPATFPDGDHIYRVEYKFTFADGTVGWTVFRGPAHEVVSG
jgi:hypothetical protein